MVLPNKARVNRRRRPIELERKSRKIDRLPKGESRAKGSRVGDDLVAAFEEMAKHLRGEIEVEAHDLPSGAMKLAPCRSPSALWRALEGSGVEFIDENGGGPGVRLQKSHKNRK
jgi:hypothetical protein